MTERTSPRVTLGVPVYNGELYLVETLESLLAQDYADFELVISDNASTDGTAEICRRYVEKDPRVRYVRNQRNMGGAYNYNRLVELARGAYFKWASADDVCAPRLLSSCVEVLDAHPDVVLAYVSTVMMDADGREIGPQESGLHLPQPEPWQRMAGFAQRRRLCNPCFGVMRTEVARGTSLIAPYVSSDITFLAEMAVAGAIHEVAEPLFFRRVTETSCGQGTLTRAQVLSWFDPTARRGHRFPMVRVLVEIERAILRSELTPADKLRTVAVFTPAWTERRSRVQYGTNRDKARGRVQSVVARLARPAP